jgi:predicted aminopeptidase
MRPEQYRDEITSGQRNPGRRFTIFSMRPRSSFLKLGAIALVAVLGGCANFGYYLQSVQGQLDILRRARPIDEVIEQPDTPQPLREKLAAVLRIREFASHDLGLPENASYRRYSDLDRPFALWNVFAAPEFSTRPLEWCFPFAGCVKYRGYFARTEADRFAATLQQEGDDVFVGGVPAYSTLGWFADPVLNTFIKYPEAEVARLIFHELAHQVVYVRDDSVFNESFAVCVQQEGVRRWLERYGTAQDKQTFALLEQRREQFTELIQRYRKRLQALYDQPLPEDTMRADKARLFAELAGDYQVLKKSWGGWAGYDRWFEQHPNNALLASVAIYTQLVPAFRTLLAQQGGELPGFYRAVKALAALPVEQRTARLAELNDGRTATAAEAPRR